MSINTLLFWFKAKVSAVKCKCQVWFWELYWYAKLLQHKAHSGGRSARQVFAMCQRNFNLFVCTGADFSSEFHRKTTATQIISHTISVKMQRFVSQFLSLIFHVSLQDFDKFSLHALKDDEFKQFYYSLNFGGDFNKVSRTLCLIQIKISPSFWPGRCQCWRLRCGTHLRAGRTKPERFFMYLFCICICICI